MNDRELLEMAAKAASVSGHWVERCPEDGYPTYTCGLGLEFWNSLWNPLTSDGDALRLAYGLKISITFSGERHDVRRGTPAFDICRLGDLADIRREIVHCAAEIGRAIK